MTPMTIVLLIVLACVGGLAILTRPRRTLLRAVRQGTFVGALDTLGHHTDLSSGVAVAVTGSRQVLASGVRVLFGYAVAETTGSAGAVIRLRDGTTATSPVLVAIRLAQGESVRDWFANAAVEVTSHAVYVEVVSGSVEGVIYWG